MNRWSENNRDIAAGALLMLAGSLILFFMPSYIGYISTITGAGPGQLGLITGSETWAIAMASLLSPWWSKYASTRSACVAAVTGCVVGNFASLWVSQALLLMAIRIPTGFLEGILYSLSFKVLGKSSNPVRAMGIASTALVVSGTSGLWLAPRLEHVFHLNGSIAIVIIFCAALVPFLPALSADKLEMISGVDARDGARPWIGLVGQALWFGGPGAVWAFSQPVARLHGLPAGQIADALAIGAACGVTGPLFCGWFGDRAGKVPMIVLSTFGVLVSTIALVSQSTFASVTIDLIALNIFWNVGSVYMFALICDGDDSGRASLLVPASHAFGFAIGPMVAGSLADHYSYSVLPAFLAGISALGFLVLVPLWRSSRMGRPQACTAPQH